MRSGCIFFESKIDCSWSFESSNLTFHPSTTSAHLCCLGQVSRLEEGRLAGPAAEGQDGVDGLRAEVAVEDDHACVGAQDEVAVLPDDLGPDRGVDGHVAHAEDEPAGVVGEGVVHGAPPAIEDPHV